jgi:hypothetical protein
MVFAVYCLVYVVYRLVFYKKPSVCKLYGKALDFHGLQFSNFHFLIILFDRNLVVR